MQRGMDPRNQELDWENLRDMIEARRPRTCAARSCWNASPRPKRIEPRTRRSRREIEVIAEGTRQSVEQVRAALTKQGGERSIADRLRNRKALDLLIENARVSEEEWSEETAPKSTTAAVAGTPQRDRGVGAVTKT